MSERVERQQIVDMLRREAASVGLDFARFFDLGRAGELDNPNLRDLWLIWGDLLTEADLDRPVPA